MSFIEFFPKRQSDQKTLCCQAVTRYGVLLCHLLVMMSLAQRLVIPSRPEQNVITTTDMNVVINNLRGNINGNVAVSASSPVQTSQTISVLTVVMVRVPLLISSTRTQC